MFIFLVTITKAHSSLKKKKNLYRSYLRIYSTQTEEVDSVENCSKPNHHGRVSSEEKNRNCSHDTRLQHEHIYEFQLSHK